MRRIVNAFLWRLGWLMAIVLGPSNATALIEAWSEASPPPPVYTCDDLEFDVSGMTSTFTVKATVKNGAEITGYSYHFGDQWGLYTSDPSVRHTFAEPGTYPVSVTVRVKVNGERKTVTSPDCEDQRVTVPSPAR